MLIDCRFGNNSVPTYDLLDLPGGEGGYGGGMCNYEGSSPILINCTFNENLAGGGGGILNCLECNPTLTDCIFSNNTAEFGGGILNYMSSPKVTNCTFAANFADFGRGMINLQSSSPMLTNCILWDGPDEVQNYDSTIMITYSDVQGSWPGESNISTDPCFADMENGDYHLKSQAGRWDPNNQSWVQDANTSPCIDAGNPSSPIGYEPFPNGGRVNMGAYGGAGQASKSYFGAEPCEAIIAGDINGDCKVDFTDFAIMALHWQQEQ
ncbi:hypothetical protein ES703_53867 [subsurface metagenome]